MGHDRGVAWTCPACDRRFGRQRQSHLRLSVLLDHDVDSPRIGRRIAPSRGFRGYVLYVVLATAADVDDEVRAWLTESFETWG